MRVIVIGCGRVGSSLAYQLYKMGHQVVVVDRHESAFDNLPVDFHGRTIEGDVLVKNTLHRAEIETADGLAAVTSSDSLNALVAYLARVEYQIPKVIARNADPRQRPLQETFGVTISGSVSGLLHAIIAQLPDSPFKTVFFDSNARIVVYQLMVPVNWHGRRLQDLLPDKESRFLKITRAGKQIPVQRDGVLEGGDIVYICVDTDESEELRRRLGSRQERMP